MRGFAVRSSPQLTNVGCLAGAAELALRVSVDVRRPSVLLCYAKAKPSAALRQSNAAGRSGAASRGAAWVGDERAEREWRGEGRGERGETAVASLAGWKEGYVDLPSAVI